MYVVRISVLTVLVALCVQCSQTQGTLMFILSLYPGSWWTLPLGTRLCLYLLDAAISIAVGKFTVHCPPPEDDR